MLDENAIVRERQKLIRREMDRRRVLLKQVQLDGGWDHVSTVASYFPADKEPATMSVAALFRLIEKEALPIDLLSLLLPDGFVIVRKPESIDYADFAAKAQEFLGTYIDARREDSEAGPDIGPTEASSLLGKVVKLKAA